MSAAGPAAVAFEAIARPLLIAHAVIGLTAVGAATHFAAYAVLAARRAAGSVQLRRFAIITPLALVAQLLLGSALYPNYRVRVRLADLQASAPVVVRLFDFKEHAAALALALVLAAALVARVRATSTLQPERERALRWSGAALSLGGAALVWTAALIGLYVTARHPVGLR